MHPEIKKFWEDAGYWIIVDLLEGTYPNDLWRYYWVLIKDEREVGYAGVSEDVPPQTKDAPCSTYFWGGKACWSGKAFSEKEMLRIIKMKTFS